MRWWSDSNPPTDQDGSGEDVTKLEFQLNDKVKAAVEEARATVQEKCDSLSVCAAQYDRYGSNFIKSSGLRADPLMQLAFQVPLASSLKYRDPARCSAGDLLQTVWGADSQLRVLQHCSFQVSSACGGEREGLLLCCRHGRTETIRPATGEAKTCAELLQPSHPASISDMMSAVLAATKKHFDLTRNAAMGRPYYLVTMVMW